MKKNYIRLYIFEAIMLMLLLVNSFVYNFLSGYGMVLFIAIALLIFKSTFNFEKENYPDIKRVVLEIGFFLLIFFLLFYLLGIFIGFSKTQNYLNIYGILNYIIPFVISVAAQEFLRFMLLKKSEGSKGLPIMTLIVFIFMTMTNVLNLAGFETAKSQFLFFALTLLPSISDNILCTYMAMKIGYTPNIVYRLVTGLYIYLLPVVPNPNEYLKSVIDFLLPLALLYRVHSFLKEEDDDEFVERDYKKKYAYMYIIPTVLIAVLVYLVSGYFRYYAIAVASESMTPEIDLGDAVIVDQKYQPNELEEGAVIAYRYNNLIVVHRIYNISSDDGQKIIYTKGDANQDADMWHIGIDDVIGVVKLKVKYIGLPTVSVKNLLERSA